MLDLCANISGKWHRDEKLRVKPKVTSIAPSECQSANGRHVIKPPSTTGRPVTAPTYNLLSSPPHLAEPPPVTDRRARRQTEPTAPPPTPPPPPPLARLQLPAMSVETERSSTESSAASGLDFEDTALTLRLPGSDPDRKRASTSDPDCPSPTAAASDSPPSPKYARVPSALLSLLPSEIWRPSFLS